MTSSAFLVPRNIFLWASRPSSTPWNSLVGYVSQIYYRLQERARLLLGAISPKVDSLASFLAHSSGTGWLVYMGAYHPAPHSSGTRWVDHPVAHCSVAHSFSVSQAKASDLSYYLPAGHILYEATTLAAEILSGRFQTTATALISYRSFIYRFAHSSESGLW